MESNLYYSSLMTLIQEILEISKKKLPRLIVHGLRTVIHPLKRHVPFDAST